MLFATVDKYVFMEKCLHASFFFDDVQGSTGEKGERGERGKAGVRGKPGIRGDKGDQVSVKKSKLRVSRSGCLFVTSGLVLLVHG